MVLPTHSSIEGECTCRHSVFCNCECHGRHCDPTEHVCSIEYLPDEGGLTPWGCPTCTPGAAMAHLSACAFTVIVAPTPSILIVDEAPTMSPDVSSGGGGSAP
jgi:hypothetical protein